MDLEKNFDQSYKDDLQAAAASFTMFLKLMTPVHPLEWDIKLMYASRHQALDAGTRGLVGHAGSDGSAPLQRCGLYTQNWLGADSESVSYGDMDPMATILNLGIDCRVPTLVHRTALFEKQYYHMGCFTGYHAKHKKMTVITYNGIDPSLKKPDPELNVSIEES